MKKLRAPQQHRRSQSATTRRCIDFHIDSAILSFIFLIMNEKLETASDQTVNVVLDKLNAGDGLSCFLRVDCDTGENMAVYILDTVEESIEMAHNELTSFYQNVEFYVIAFDGGWIDKSGIEHRAVIIEVEDRASGSHRRRAYVIQANEDGTLSPTGEIVEFPSSDWSLFRQ